jgi:hypothetical protein
MEADVAAKQAFETEAKAQGWRCSRCDKPIAFADRETFLESKRCRKCHEELDTESGTIPAL